jgi:sodium/potassium-transporting ATPase subunit alpha
LLFFIFEKGLKVEQSALNGESESIDISEKSLSENPIESRNIIFNGCLCLEGSALGVVIKTGDETFLGLVAQQTSKIGNPPTLLQKELRRFVAILTLLSIVIALFVFLIGVGKHPDKASDYFITVFIIIIIANVPQVTIN